MVYKLVQMQVGTGTCMGSTSFVSFIGKHNNNWLYSYLATSARIIQDIFFVSQESEAVLVLRMRLKTLVV